VSIQIDRGTDCRTRTPVGRIVRLAAALGLAVFAAACTQTKTFVSDTEIPEISGTTRVLLMPSDVEVSELTAAGLSEPNAAWTASAKTNVETALNSLMAARNAQLVPYRGAAGDGTIDDYVPALALPTKKDKFDWSMGEAATVLRRSFDADYALFIYIRDSFSSGGRTALIVLGALVGAAVPGGRQTGFASLVDLRSGDVIWFNHLFKETGDLREPDSARDGTESLLKNLPL
jgi:hypothetical protein